MAVSDRFFKIFKRLFPFSNAFSLFIEKNFSNHIKSLTVLPQDLKDYIYNIYLDLFPSTTRCIEKWEEELGVIFPNSDESNRRLNIDTAWKSRGGQGAAYIQATLQNAGFDVQVHENNPPADPDIFLNSIPVMFCAGPAAFAGNDQAFAGKTGGDLLVNGPVLTNIPVYLSVCDGDKMFCGNDDAIAGRFDKFGTADRIYQITDDPDLWGAFFFIGGDATRDPITHKLTKIENTIIDVHRKNEFIRLILKLKPAQTWAGLMVNYE